MALAALALAGCSETVAVLSIGLTFPPDYGRYKCPTSDPSVPQQITITASCDEGRTQVSYALAKGTFSLDEIPMGACTIEVELSNRFGRVVLAGEADVKVAAGVDLKVPITLVKQSCKHPPCDTDGDELLDDDERGLKTNPKASDTDGDGMNDWVEVMECCKNPLVRDQPGSCRLINSVVPLLGPVGTTVAITSTDTLIFPKVMLGGAPLEQVLHSQGSRDLLGKVGQAAVLGDVALTSNNVKYPPFKLLFTTLQQRPQAVIALQQGGTKTALMQEVVDLTHQGKMLVLLGQAKTLWSPTTPILLVVDRTTGQSSRHIIQVKAAPRSVAVVGPRVTVLLEDNAGKTTLQVLKLNSGKLTLTRTIALNMPHPVDMVPDPKGAVLVLFRKHLAWITGLATSTGQHKVFSKELSAAASTTKSAAASPACVGLAYDSGKTSLSGAGSAFLSCNLPAVGCAPNTKCSSVAALVRVPSVLKCLVGAAGAPAPKDCFTHLWDKGEAVGAPVIDNKAKQVYLMTTNGIKAAPLLSKAGQPSGGATLGSVVSAKFQQTSATGVLALDVKGQLHALERADKLLRVELFSKDAAKQKGWLYSAGDGTEPLMLAISPDGSVLDVVRRRKKDGIQSLISVCLARCTGCLCAP